MEEKDLEKLSKEELKTLFYQFYDDIDDLFLTNRNNVDNNILAKYIGISRILIKTVNK